MYRNAGNRNARGRGRDDDGRVADAHLRWAAPLNIAHAVEDVLQKLDDGRNVVGHDARRDGVKHGSTPDAGIVRALCKKKKKNSDH